MKEKLEKLQELKKALENQIKALRGERSDAEGRVQELTANISKTEGRIFEIDEIYEFLTAEEQNGDQSPPNTDIE